MLRYREEVGEIYEHIGDATFSNRTAMSAEMEDLVILKESSSSEEEELEKEGEVATGSQEKSKPTKESNLEKVTKKIMGIGQKLISPYTTIWNFKKGELKTTDSMTRVEGSESMFDLRAKYLFPFFYISVLIFATTLSLLLFTACFIIRRDEKVEEMSLLRTFLNTIYTAVLEIYEIQEME